METSVASYNNIALITADGRKVWSKPIDVSNGILIKENLLSIHEKVKVNDLAAGIYLLEVARNGNVKSRLL